MSTSAARRKSDQHPAIRSYRETLHSIRENQLPELRELDRKADELHERMASSQPPSLDERSAERRDESPAARRDPRREEDGEVPVDVVTLPVIRHP